MSLLLDLQYTGPLLMFFNPESISKHTIPSHSVQNPIHSCRLNPHSCPVLFPSTSLQYLVLTCPALPSSSLHFVFSVDDLPSYISKRILTIQCGKPIGSHLLFQYLWIFIILFSQDLAVPLSTLSSYLGGTLYLWSLSFPLVPPVVSSSLQLMTHPFITELDASPHLRVLPCLQLLPYKIFPGGVSPSEFYRALELEDGP